MAKKDPRGRKPIPGKYKYIKFPREVLKELDRIAERRMISTPEVIREIVMKGVKEIS